MKITLLVGGQFDLMNQLTNRSSTNNYSVNYTYYADGQRHTMTDASGTTTYTYDNRNRLQTKAMAWTSGPSMTLNYTYDLAGSVSNLYSSTNTGVNLTYNYDALGRLFTVKTNGNTVNTYGYDAVGNLQTMAYGNGVTNLYTFDSMNRLTTLAWKTNGTTIASFSYQLGKTGNRTNLVEAVNGVNRTNQWQYDHLYRLTNENVIAPTAGTLGYNYDLVGNRLGRTATGSLGLTNQTFTFNTNDWLNTDSYDNNGNTTNSISTTYTYDPEDRLVSVTSNSTTISIVYDGDGNRVKKTVGGVTTYYLVDTVNPSGYAQVLEEWVAGGGATNLSRVYAYGSDLISQRIIGAGTTYYGFDGHGSTRFLTGSSGAISDTFVYDAYGTLTASTGTTPNSYLYCGQQWDSDLGFYYDRARYLDANTGRFWTSDTDEGDNWDPASLHKYRYASNDPIDFSDPSGLSWYAYDGQKFHVHAYDQQGKLTYIANMQDDGNVIYLPKPGHPASEFNVPRAKAHFSSAVKQRSEFKKMQAAVADAYDRLNDKPGIARVGINLRRARFLIRSLSIISIGLALNPSNADAVDRFKTAIQKIDRSLTANTEPEDSDIDDAMIAVKDIYGNEPAALWYWDKLYQLKEKTIIKFKLNSARQGGDSGDNVVLLINIL